MRPFKKFFLSMAMVGLVAAVGCGDDDDPSPPTTGQIGVTTVTTGDDIDADDYTLTVDGVDEAAIGVNAVVIVPDLTAGTYSIGLGGVAANCAVQNNPRDVVVTAGLTENTQFDLACAALNQPPVADAGMDQTVVDADDSGSEDVTLDGSASTDVDGTIASWSWAEDGTEIATGEMPTAAFAVGVHTVVLTVTDDDGATGTDNVMVTVEAPVGNQPPTADAGA
ncbi:MAG: PKD domain-containing protein, partial [Gemmatimonadetes bacterium]|nr:PKD domain-containing protein [Gemmatimonadota bacterium]